MLQVPTPAVRHLPKIGKQHRQELQQGLSASRAQDASHLAPQILASPNDPGRGTRPQTPPIGRGDGLRLLTELPSARRRARFPTSSASHGGGAGDPRRPHPRWGPALPLEVAGVGEVIAQPR